MNASSNCDTIPNRSLLILLAMGLLVGMVSCKPATIAPATDQLLQRGEIRLSFETIEQASSPHSGFPYPGLAPQLVIASTLAQAQPIIRWTSPKAQAQLESLDYGQYLALAVFQGSKPNLQYSVEVKTVTRKSDTVTVYAQFREPQPGREANPSETSPYHLIRIPKEGAWGRYITFNLSVNGRIQVSAYQYVP